MNQTIPNNSPSSRLIVLLDGFSVYTERRVIGILFLGFSSGLPLALTFGTLSLWLAEEGISKTSIGLFALAGVPYTFKFLWSPLVDQMPIPLLTAWLGRRRGWALLTQLALMLSIFLLGLSNPYEAPLKTALLALCTAFWSASQDIVIDAYRIEILDENQYGAGAAMIVLGYRLGMLVSGAMALYLASFFGWMVCYSIMAALMGVGMVTILLSPEPQNRSKPFPSSWDATHASVKYRRLENIVTWIKSAVFAPLTDFIQRKSWFLVLLFILFYKLGDALASVMSQPFYLELAFSKIEIANISKIFGLVSTLVGSILGGIIVNRLGIMKSLFYCGIVQMFSNLMFVLLAQTGHSVGMLIVTIAVENLSGGMGTAAFVAYLSSLCTVAYTATQYALLTSFMAFGRTILSSLGGSMADQMSWTPFFLMTTLAALPGLFLLWAMIQYFPVQPTTPKGEINEHIA